MRIRILVLLSFLFLAACGSSPIMKKDVAPVLVADDFSFTEGPAADQEGNVFFTDQPNNRILKWSAETEKISVWMDGAGRANGLFFDNKGNLVACADDQSELWKIDPDKNVAVLLDEFDGKRLNGPNDLWVDEKGGIYFTDPYYQRDYWQRTKPDLQEKNVFYLSPEGENVKIVAGGFKQPNGIIGSVKDEILYIADIGDRKTYSYEIGKNGKLSNRKLFIEMGSDGMTMDEKGNVYLTGDGVSIFNRSGKRIEHIRIDRDWTANVTFGGRDHKTLFITASNCLFKLDMNVKGNRWK